LEHRAEGISPGRPIIFGSAVKIAVRAEGETTERIPASGFVIRKAEDHGKYSRGSDLEYCAHIISIDRCSTVFRGAVHVPITPLRHNTRVGRVAPIRGIGPQEVVAHGKGL